MKVVDEIRRMSEVTGIDLIHLGTVASQSELIDPAAGQPLATALAIVAGQRLLTRADPNRVILAGHGTGEVAAAVLAGILPSETGMELAVEIGRAHAEIAATIAGGQVAVLGGYPPEVEARAAELCLSVAAYNGAGEIVLSGPRVALDELLAAPPRHTRVEPLPATGAFSSDLMAPAAEVMRRSVPAGTVAEPRLRLVSGVNGRPPISGRAYLEGVANLLTGSVHWDLIMDHLTAAGIQMIMELPPAGLLTAFVSRGAPGVTAVPLRSPQLLDEASAALGSR
jgi:[acyl-carrier-protein] S-malonyltransferase